MKTTTKKFYRLKKSVLILYALLLGVAVQAQDGYLTFDGTNDYVALPIFYQGTQTITQVSVEAWVRTSFSDVAYNSNWAIVDFDRSDYYNVYIQGDGKVGFSTDGGDTHDMAGTAVINDGQWHHVAAVFDGTNKYIYVDGELDATALNPHSGIGLGTTKLRYGFIGDGSEATDYNGNKNNIFFDGDISEVRIWHKALSASEVANNMGINGISGSEADLVAYYRFNDGTATDLTGTHNGELFGPTFQNTDGVEEILGIGFGGTSLGPDVAGLGLTWDATLGTLNIDNSEINLWDNNTDSSIIIGEDAANASGDYTGSLIIGSNASFLVSSKRSVLLGHKAGQSLSNNNVAIGFSAGRDSENGVNNTYLGYKSGEGNTGNGNTFLGYLSGTSSSGADNIFLGYQSGQQNEGGFTNIFIGKGSGKQNKGNQNVFIGGVSGNANQGNGNLGIGSYTLSRNLGNNNLAIGQNSGVLLEQGSNNLLFGNGAGITLSEGSNNVIIGSSVSPVYDINNPNQVFNDRLLIHNTSITQASPALIDGNFAERYLNIHGTLNVGQSTETIADAIAHFDGRVYISEADDRYTDDDDSEKGLDAASSIYGDYLLWIEKGLVTNHTAYIQVANWHDYVFEDDYDLKSVEETNAFIKTHGHLPNIPSAKEVKKNGFEAVDMTGRLLKTIEEQMLYIIDQNDRIKKQEKSIQALENILEAQKKSNEELVKRLVRLEKQMNSKK